VIEKTFTLEPVVNRDHSKSMSFHVRGTFIPTDPIIVEELHRLSLLHPGKNIRFLFHESKSSPLHIMLIKESQELYYPTHIHTSRHEIHYLLEGSLGVHILHQDGRIKYTFLPTPGNRQVTSVEPGIPHVTIPLTKSVVYLEIKNGPSVEFKDECFISDFEAEIGAEEYQQYLISESASLK